MSFFPSFYICIADNLLYTVYETLLINFLLYWIMTWTFFYMIMRICYIYLFVLFVFKEFIIPLLPFFYIYVLSLYPYLYITLIFYCSSYIYLKRFGILFSLLSTFFLNPFSELCPFNEDCLPFLLVDVYLFISYWRPGSSSSSNIITFMLCFCIFRSNRYGIYTQKNFQIYLYFSTYLFHYFWTYNFLKTYLNINICQFMRSFIIIEKK